MRLTCRHRSPVLSLFSLLPAAAGSFGLLLSAAAAAAEPVPVFPAPDTVSEAIRPMVAAYRTTTFLECSDVPQLLRYKAYSYPIQTRIASDLIDKYQLSLGNEPVAGINCYQITPANVPQEHQDKVLLFLHGGGYVLGAGAACLPEGLVMAGLTGYRTVAVDYAMPPEDPAFPQAVDDVLAVYKELLKTYPASKIGVFGSSAGGALTLILVQQARAQGLPVPGAVIAGTPWSDVTKTGDTYYTNEQVDNVIVSADMPFTQLALQLYAGDMDLRDPRISPVYGDFSGFSPTFLVSGTRDLLLSATVRVQAKLIKNKIPQELLVLEGLSHCQYYFLPDAPESRLYHKAARQFWERYLH